MDHQTERAATLLVAITGDIYSGLWYLVIVGACFLPETAPRHARAGDYQARRAG